jgi:hypothetical protein
MCKRCVPELTRMRQWWYDNLFVGSVAYGARTAPMWNLAANAEGGPTIPGTTSCGGGCRRTSLRAHAYLVAVTDITRQRSS